MTKTQHLVRYGLVALLLAVVVATIQVASDRGGSGAGNEVIPLTQPAASSGFEAAALFGDPDSDLIYTPVTPCRIFDTRIDSRGLMAEGETRDFAVNGSSISNQGGDVSNCPDVPLDPPAVIINLTVTGAQGNGNATIFDSGASPFASTVNFTQGVNIANTTITPVCVDCGAQSDVSVRILNSTAQVVGDIVGYFRPVECEVGTLVHGLCFTNVQPTDATFQVAQDDCEDDGGRLPSTGEAMLVQAAIGGGGGHTSDLSHDVDAVALKNIRVDVDGLPFANSVSVSFYYRCVFAP